MKKKALATTILAVILLAMCATMFCACANRKPRKVEIEIINPLTGKLLEQDEVLDLPTEQTYLQVRVKGKRNKYLTDDDLPDTTVEESLQVKVSRLWKSNFKEVLTTDGSLPIEEDVVASNYYEIEVKFDCKPANSKEDEYRRKYEEKTATVCFYSNKEWRGTNYFSMAIDAWTERREDVVCENPPTSIEEWGMCYIDRWKNVSELRAKVDSLEELNALRSKKEYPFFNEKYADDRLNKAMKELDKFDDKYFEENSLLFIMEYKGEPDFHDLCQLVIDRDNLFVTTIQPEGNYMYPGIICVRVMVIQMDRELAAGVKHIEYKEMRR